MDHRQYSTWLDAAVREAEKSWDEGGIPIGAVLADEAGGIVARGHNRPIGDRDPTAHAEIVALRAAAAGLGNYRLPGVTLYVTVEPCAMCAGACLQARVAHLVFGAVDEKAGAVVSQARLLETGRWNHAMRVTAGVLAEEAGALLREFFRTRRAEGYRSGRTGLDSKSSWGR